VKQVFQHDALARLWWLLYLHFESCKKKKAQKASKEKNEKKHMIQQVVQCQVIDR
jgi:hypothetical protein